jgi:hypothetical protein
MSVRRPPVYGVLAEFASVEELVVAARATSDAGYRAVDAFTPFPVEKLHEAIGFHGTRLPWIVFAGGVAGALTGFGLQVYAGLDYVQNIGGRPLNSWPAFIPITFELTVLGAALAAVFGLLALNGLPTPYHPLFNIPRFELASRDRFFLVIKSKDSRFEAAGARRFLEGLSASGVWEVPW